ncbi:MAG: hypothetical protein GX793_06405 [Bacteroidales bacterium]|jgi:hypothetical protein|nr:type II restriction endonuclease [Bacteroidales bacterium]NLB86674.1 hypothetical protein [Bacteroidales bacterium]
MTKRFETFIAQLSKTNANLNYFTDFEKINKNLNKISIKLNQLNYLLGKGDIKLEIENPQIFGKYRQKIHGFEDSKQLNLFLAKEPEAEYERYLNF